MRSRTYDVLAWVFTLPAVIITFCILITNAYIYVEPVLLVLGISICGMVFSINAAKRGAPKKRFLLPLILSVICMNINGGLFVSCVMLNIMCEGLPFFYTNS